MASHNDFGKWGEQHAVDYLQECGYAILCRNFSYQKAEVDIIAQKASTLVFIEVKSRHSITFAQPETAVRRKKIVLLVRAANAFVSKFPDEVSVRFDIISVYKKNGKFELNHLVDAFYIF